MQEEGGPILALLNWIASIFAGMPLGTLDTIGFLTVVIMYLVLIPTLLGYTIVNWKLGKFKQRWGSKALSIIALLVALSIVLDFFGGMFWLIPGLESFESLVYIVTYSGGFLFGYPGALAVLVADVFRDSITGVFSMAIAIGYPMNMSCAYVNFKLLGKDPDFKKPKTWALWLIPGYGFTMLSNFAWSWVCKTVLPIEACYYLLLPSFTLTTAISYILIPFVTLVLLPVVKRYRLFWKDLPGYYSERPLDVEKWTFESGKA